MRQIDETLKDNRDFSSVFIYLSVSHLIIFLSSSNFKLQILNLDGHLFHKARGFAAVEGAVVVGEA